MARLIVNLLKKIGIEATEDLVSKWLQKFFALIDLTLIGACLKKFHGWVEGLLSPVSKIWLFAVLLLSLAMNFLWIWRIWCSRSALRNALTPYPQNWTWIKKGAIFTDEKSQEWCAECWFNKDKPVLLKENEDGTLECLGCHIRHRLH